MSQDLASRSHHRHLHDHDDCGDIFSENDIVALPVVTEMNAIHQSLEYDRLDDVEALIAAAPFDDQLLVECYKNDWHIGRFIDSLPSYKSPTHFLALSTGDDTTIERICRQLFDKVSRKKREYLQHIVSAEDLGELGVVRVGTLHLATIKGKAKLVALLLEYGSDVDCLVSEQLAPECHSELTSLYWAAWCGHVSIARLLLERGASVDGASATTTPLCAAATRGFTDIVQLLLAHSANVNCTSTGGGTPLLAATANGHNVVVSLLLSAGANVNMDDCANSLTPVYSPLYAASYHGYDVIAGDLLKHGADVNVGGHLVSSSPLYSATLRGHRTVVQLLLMNGSETSSGECVPLLAAAQNGHTDIVKLLVTFDADVNIRSVHEGVTALLIASQHGHTEVASLLLQHGADVNAQCHRGVSALYLAVLHGHADVVDLLLTHNADALTGSPAAALSVIGTAAENGLSDVIDRLFASLSDDIIRACAAADDMSAMFIAADSGHVDVVKTLLARNMDVDGRRNNDGATCLHAAAAHGHDAVIDVLLAAGADVNSRRHSDGATALIAAVERAQKSAVSRLLSAGADVNAATTDGGLTALFIASEDGRDDIATQLLAAGADVHVISDCVMRTHGCRVSVMRLQRPAARDN